jgi:hypothetical protein
MAMTLPRPAIEVAPTRIQPPAMRNRPTQATRSHAGGHGRRAQQQADQQGQGLEASLHLLVWAGGPLRAWAQPATPQTYQQVTDAIFAVLRVFPFPQK